jgi:hypothetical protein
MTAVPTAGGDEPEPILVSIQDIHISAHFLVTPAGTRPLAGTQLQFIDMTRRDQVIPGWAIALAVIGALFFLLGLLFLFVRQTRVTGFFQVTATNGDFVYQTGVPGSYNYSVQFADIQSRVEFARSLIAAA